VTLDELLNHPALRGVSLVGCTVGGKPAMKGTVAHAHWRSGRARGWICLESRRHLNRTTVTHELAHLILGSDAHGLAWKRMVRQLGGRVERRYLTKGGD
jgi:hypothetical protein